MPHTLRERGSLFLMYLLIAVILASPLADLYPRIGAFLALIVLGAVLFGASLAGNPRIVVRIAIPFSVLWLIARFLEEFVAGQHHYNHLAHVAGLALSCILLWAIFDHLGRTAEITSSIIAEAVVSYLIMAIGFSQIFWILNEVLPDSFNPKIPPSQSTTFLYFSMITLTSVGYGDILPVNPFVRLLAAFESMTGIFFVSLVIARLVSSYHPTRPDPDDHRVP